MSNQNSLWANEQKMKAFLLTKKNQKRLLLLALLPAFLSIEGCGSGSNNSASVAPVSIQQGDGYYRITMDYTTGLSNREMGRELAQKIRQQVPNYESYMDDMLARQLLLTENVSPPLTPVGFGLALNRAREIIKNVPIEYVDELNGMQEVFNSTIDQPGDGVLSANELLVIQLFPDVLRVTGCSASGVFGDSSISGNTVFGRNLDWFSYPLVPASHIQALTTFKKKNSTIVNFSAAGFLPAGSSFNQSKVFGAVLDAEIPTLDYPTNLNGFRSYVFDLRYALENNTTLQGVADFMSNSGRLYAFNHLIFLADKNVQKVLENNVRQPNASPPVRALRSSTSTLNPNIPNPEQRTWVFGNAIATVNDFRLPGTYFEPDDVSNSSRWTSFKSLYNTYLANNSRISIQQLKSIAGFPGTNQSGDDEQGAIFLHSKESPPTKKDPPKYSTMQSIIMNMETLETWAHFAPAGGPFPTLPTYRRVPHLLE